MSSTGVNSGRLILHPVYIVLAAATSRRTSITHGSRVRFIDSQLNTYMDKRNPRRPTLREIYRFEKSEEKVMILRWYVANHLSACPPLLPLLLACFHAFFHALVNSVLRFSHSAFISSELCVRQNPESSERERR